MSLTNAWPEAKIAGKEAKDSLFSYFYRGEKQISSAGEFARQWNKITEYDFTPKELTHILYRTINLVKDHHESQWIGDIRNFVRTGVALWEQAAIPKLPEFEPADLALSLWSFATLGNEPSREFMEPWLEAALFRMPEFAPLDLSTSLTNLARLCEEPPPEFMEEWHEAALRQLPLFSQSQATSSLWAVSVIDLISSNYNGEPVAAAFLEKTQKQKQKDFSQAQQTYTALLHFDFSNNLKLERKDDMTSVFEDHFANTLKTHAYSFARQHYLPDISHNVDFYLPSRSGRRLLIETDGHWHFNRPAGAKNLCQNYNGGTYMQSALICKYYPEDTVLRLPSDEYKKIQRLPIKKQSAALFAMMDGAYDIGPGVHRVAYDNDRISFDTIARLARQNVPALSAPSPTP